MPFKINDFMSELSQPGGVGYQHAFSVNIMPPPRMFGQLTGGQSPRALGFRGTSAAFPGRSIQNTNIKHGIQAPFKMAVAPIYTDVQTSIICSANLKERDFFLSWQDLIVGSHRNSQGENYNLGYYYEYVGMLEIRQYDLTAQSDSEWSHASQIVEAYPVQVSEMPVSWNSVDIHVVNIVWAYRRFTDATNAGVLGGKLPAEFNPILAKANPFTDVFKNLPSLPELPSLPSLPSIPSIPNISIPDFSSLAGNIPRLPSIPRLPNIPRLPTIQIPRLPTLEIPNIPGFPSFL